ncbi:MAG: hypothetical protein KDE14_02925 [Rhodobacteraceae bacterium]|nr:hypothetical protein [Paracoccaceae bacterium]
MASSLVSCGGGGRRGPDSREAGQISRDLGPPGGAPVRPGPSANDAYVNGLNARRDGKCDLAAEILKPVANLGPGYEGAQFALGDCLTRTAATSASTSFADGLTWLIRAADAGWAEAQGRLAEIYALGPDDMRKPEEAAYWLALYVSNTQKARIGFEPLPADSLKRIADTLMPEQITAGEARARSWTRKAWIPPRMEEPPPGPDGEGGGGPRGRRPPPN